MVSGGIGGFIDIVSGLGLTRHDEDFVQTFAVWEIDSGAFLSLPLSGPPGLRDGVGQIGNYQLRFLSYIDHIPTWNSVWGRLLLNQRERRMESTWV